MPCMALLALIQPMCGGDDSPSARPGSRTRSQRFPRLSVLRASTGNFVRSSVIGREDATRATTLLLELGFRRTLCAPSNATVGCSAETDAALSAVADVAPANRSNEQSVSVIAALIARPALSR